MNVKEYIIKNGIKQLQDVEIISNGKKYKIQLSDHDLEYHSLDHETWKGDKIRFNQYHERGNYRFYAMDENGMCIWVYPSTDIYADETVNTKYGEIKLKVEDGKMKIDFDNCKFNSIQHFRMFLDDTDLLHKVVGY